MVAAGLVDDPAGQFALESPLLETVFDGDRGFGAPRRAIRNAPITSPATGALLVSLTSPSTISIEYSPPTSLSTWYFPINPF